MITVSQFITNLLPIVPNNKIDQCHLSGKTSQNHTDHKQVIQKFPTRNLIPFFKHTTHFILFPELQTWSMTVHRVKNPRFLLKWYLWWCLTFSYLTLRQIRQIQVIRQHTSFCVNWRIAYGSETSIAKDSPNRTKYDGIKQKKITVFKYIRKITLFVGFEKRQRTGTGTEEDRPAAAPDVAPKCREPTKEQTRSGARILRRSDHLLLRYRRIYHHLSPEYSSSSSRSIELTLQVRRVNHRHIWYSPVFTDRWSLPYGLLTNCLFLEIHSAGYGY